MEKTDREWAKLDFIGEMQFCAIQQWADAVLQRRRDGSEPVQLAKELLGLGDIFDNVQARLTEYMAEAASTASLFVHMLDQIREILVQIPSPDSHKSLALVEAARNSLARVFGCGAYGEACEGVVATKPILQQLSRSLGEKTIASARRQLERDWEEAAESALRAVAPQFMARRKLSGTKKPN